MSRITRVQAITGLGLALMMSTAQGEEVAPSPELTAETAEHCRRVINSGEPVQRQLAIACMQIQHVHEHCIPSDWGSVDKPCMLENVAALNYIITHVIPPLKLLPEGHTQRKRVKACGTQHRPSFPAILDCIMGQTTL